MSDAALNEVETEKFCNEVNNIVCTILLMHGLFQKKSCQHWHANIRHRLQHTAVSHLRHHGMLD